VTCKLRVICEDSMVADVAVMREMHVRHHPVVIAQSRNARILYRAAIKSAELAYRISIADMQLRRFARIFLVLRRRAERNELKYAIVASNTRVARNDCMRTDLRAGVDLDMLAYRGIGTDFHIAGKPCTRMHDGAGMYRGQRLQRASVLASIARNVQIRSASVTT